VLAQQELSVRRDELTHKRQELARLRGIGIESLEARELVQLKIELEEGLRRVREAALRRNAEERVASQTKSVVRPSVSLSGEKATA
jgi:hypothetical protein